MKDVQRIREAIRKRNKKKKFRKNFSSEQTFTPSFPQEEEKHGYYPMFQEDRSNEHSKGDFFHSFILKVIFSVILFFAVGVIIQSKFDWSKQPKEWAIHALSEDFPFAKVHKWYVETFGAPFAMMPEYLQAGPIYELGDEDTLPVNGVIAQTFQKNGKGIMIQVEGESDVHAWKEGIVIFAGLDQETERTVVIQHADDRKTTYGHLSSVDVHLYQFVSQKDKIGTFIPDHPNAHVYFSMMKDREYIDPIQVIQVDDIP